jgi:uncharacterized protein YfeS
MAERLESGQLQIRSVSGSPMQQINARGVDYTIASREEARTANTMAEILDRMGRSINVMAKEKRQEEALRFAAENPITLEQLQLAKEGLPGAIPGLNTVSGDLTYFGQALKKARTLQVASAFEMEGMNALTQMLADVESGALTTEQVQQKIASINKGYTDSLTKVDPEAAIKFNATFATHGNTVLKTALEAEAKRTKAQNVIKARENFNNIKLVLEKTVSLGEYTDPATGQKYSIDIMADTLRAGLQTQTLAIGDAVLAKEIMGEFEKELRDAKVNAVTRHILTNDTLMNDPQLGRKIMTGQLDKMSNVMLGLLKDDMEAVAKINANVDIALNRRESLKKQQAADAKAEAIKQFVPLYQQAVALPEGSKQRKQIAEQIAAIARSNPDAVPLSVLKDLLEPAKAGEGNAAVYFNLRQMIYDNKITDPSQIWALTKQGLSTSNAISALDLFYRTDKQDQKDLDIGISKLAGINVVPGSVVVLDPKGQEFQRRQELVAQSKEIEARYAREGKAAPTPRQILTELETGLEKRRNSEAAKAAREQLDRVWSKQKWINGPISRKNLSQLEHLAKGDQKKERDLAQIKKLLDQAGE